MEQAQERLKADLILLEKALKTLDQALAEKKDGFIRDSVIKRFEYVFELSWKSIQMAARLEGKPCASPRSAIRTAYQLKWIEDPDTWFEMLRARNQTAHTYQEEAAEEVYLAVRDFPPLVRSLLLALRTAASV